ncbi:2'-5' RNA ligase [Pseudonocardia sp. CNS-139]|nr:2'-5' RNA ligase [Pseudonocardia sp. CNS-139]
MRLFVALTPPPDAVAELAAALAPLRAAHPGLRWLPPEQWHVTLAFLGEVDDRARADVTQRLARAAARHPAPVLAFGAAGRFGDRVLWARVQGDAGPLGRLADSVRAAARRARIPVEDRPYRPHVTLARTRAQTGLRPLVAALAGFAGREWTASDLHLVRSRLGAGPDGGALHEPLVSWPLGPGDRMPGKPRSGQ